MGGVSQQVQQDKTRIAEATKALGESSNDGSGDEYEPGSGDDYEPSGDELYTSFGSRDDSSEESRSGKHGEDDKECPEKKKVLEVNRECLEPESDVRLIGKKGLILGWGKNDDDEKSNDLNEVELTVISNSACRKAFK